MKLVMEIMSPYTVNAKLLGAAISSKGVKKVYILCCLKSFFDNVSILLEVFFASS
jgi:hypothetical protein